MRTTKQIVENQILPRIGGSIPETDECVLWPLSTTGNGYGRVMTSRITGHCRNEYVHRLIFEYVTGTPPIKGKHVMHTCDVPRCCNPRHLVQGTASENHQQKARNGRIKQIPYEVVQQIRQGLANGRSCNQLAPEFGVSVPYVIKLKNGEIKRNGKRGTYRKVAA